MPLTIHRFITKADMRPSPTLSAGQLAKQAQDQGRTVEVVTIGDLFPKPTSTETKQWLDQLMQDAANPEYAAQDAYRALRPRAREYAYSETTGIPSLRDAAACTFSRDTGIAVTAADIIIGCGGKGALNGAFHNTLKRGDRVMLAAPGWPSNYDMFPAGVEIIELQTEDGILRAEALTEALGQFPEPTLILINAPCNPTGANYTPEEREAFFAAVLAHTKSTTVASDDPYGKLVFDREPYDIRKVLKRGEAEKTCFAEGRLAVFRSVSKEYGLAGERVGYLATKHASMLKSLHLWNENKGGGMGVRNQELAEAALLYGDGFITRTVESLREKRQKLYDAVKALQFADMQNPRGTIYGWVDFAGLQGKTVPAAHSETGAAYTIASPADMMRYLIYVAGVCGVPGTPFYAPDSPARLEDWHVRISFCCEMDQLERVIANLTKAEAALV